jgi:ketosteroid isomerase-like protein
MTPNAQAELVRHFETGLDALEHHDLDGFMEELEAWFHPDVEFISIIGSAVEGGAYKGPEGIRSWFSNLLQTTDHVKWSDRETRILDEGTILFLAEFEIQGAASGAALATEVGTVFEIEGGKVRRAQTFGSHEQAIAAAETVVGADA